MDRGWMCGYIQKERCILVHKQRASQSAPYNGILISLLCMCVSCTVCRVWACIPYSSANCENSNYYYYYTKIIDNSKNHKIVHKKYKVTTINTFSNVSRGFCFREYCTPEVEV